MASRHDPQWLAEVRRPGPNGVTFWKRGEVVSGVPQGLWSRLTGGGRVPAFASGNLMEDDTDTSKFTGGCAAYAGYWNGSFANMTAVRAYAASQNARVFSYTPDGDPNADAIDMEPGLASPSDFPRFFRTKGGRGVYGYGSASWVQQIINAASGAGIARSAYKIVSAHYIGEHICGPGTCGYPQADATQFSDTYLGRSLDCTVFDSAFFGGVVNTNPWPLSVGSTGPNVVILQRGLNKWKYASPLLVTDGNFGTKTADAVVVAQRARRLPVTSVVDETLWRDLLGNPGPPLMPVYGTPRNPSADAVIPPTTDYVLTWSVPAPVTGVPVPTEYQVYVYDGVPDAAHLFQKEVTVTTTKLGVNGLKRGHIYIIHIAAAGNARYVGKDVFATLTLRL